VVSICLQPLCLSSPQQTNTHTRPRPLPFHFSLKPAPSSLPFSSSRTLSKPQLLHSQPPRRLHQQPPATPGETHTCSRSSNSYPAPASTTTAAVSPYHSGAVSSSSPQRWQQQQQQQPTAGSLSTDPPTSLRVNGQTDLHQRRLYKVTRQQATSPSPSTSAHRPAAPWSSDRPLEEEETGSAVKQNRPLLAFFLCVLQGVVYLTSGREGKRRRRQGRSARFWRRQ